MTGAVFLAAPLLTWTWGLSHAPEITLLIEQPEQRLAIAWAPPPPPPAAPVAIEEADEAPGPSGDQGVEDAGQGSQDAVPQRMEQALEEGSSEVASFTPLALERGGAVRRVVKPDEVGSRRARLLALAGLGRDNTRGRSRARGSSCHKKYKGVEEDGGDHWTVDREIVDYYTASIARFNSLGWSGPHSADDLKGWKIGGFDCNSPLHFAGLRRGDIVLRVNGKPTRTWLQVFGAYTKLRKKAEIEVQLVRRGEHHTLRYTLVEA
jgi:hypothetical protein